MRFNFCDVCPLWLRPRVVFSGMVLVVIAVLGVGGLSWLTLGRKLSQAQRQLWVMKTQYQALSPIKKISSTTTDSHQDKTLSTLDVAYRRHHRLLGAERCVSAAVVAGLRLVDIKLIKQQLSVQGEARSAAEIADYVQHLTHRDCATNIVLDKVAQKGENIIGFSIEATLPQATPAAVLEKRLQLVGR